MAIHPAILRTVTLTLTAAALTTPALSAQSTAPAPAPKAPGRSPLADVKITAIRCHTIHKLALVELSTDAGVTASIIAG
jgi:hypothetical protein